MFQGVSMTALEARSKITRAREDRGRAPACGEDREAQMQAW
jgi:hypothetical protein